MPRETIGQGQRVGVQQMIVRDVLESLHILADARDTEIDVHVEHQHVGVLPVGVVAEHHEDLDAQLFDVREVRTHESVSAVRQSRLASNADGRRSTDLNSGR